MRKIKGLSALLGEEEINADKLPMLEQLLRHIPLEFYGSWMIGVQ